jgi:hypothetical protein
MNLYSFLSPPGSVCTQIYDLIINIKLYCNALRSYVNITKHFINLKVIAVCKYIQREYLCSKSLLLYKYIQIVCALKLYYFEKILISLVSFIRLLIRSIELEGEGIQAHTIYRSLCLFRPKTMLVCQLA